MKPVTTALPKLLFLSCALIVIGWFADIAILGIVGCLLLIPVGIIMLGALIWNITP